MVFVFAAVGILAVVATIYFVWRSREFRKFLSGAFFVSGGIQLYLYFAGVSVPILGTDLIVAPEVSLMRAIPHLLFCVLTFYFGFMKKPTT
jgi:hypothetical protein